MIKGLDANLIIVVYHLFMIRNYICKFPLVRKYTPVLIMFLKIMPRGIWIYIPHTTEVFELVCYRIHEIFSDSEIIITVFI